MGKAKISRAFALGAVPAFPSTSQVLAEQDSGCKTTTPSIICAPNPWLGNFPWSLPGGDTYHAPATADSVPPATPPQPLTCSSLQTTAASSWESHTGQQSQPHTLQNGEKINYKNTLQQIPWPKQFPPDSDTRCCSPQRSNRSPCSL